MHREDGGSFWDLSMGDQPGDRVFIENRQPLQDVKNLIGGMAAGRFDGPMESLKKLGPGDRGHVALEDEVGVVEVADDEVET